MTYNWQQVDWPNFRYQLLEIEDTLFAFIEEAGLNSGILKGLSEDYQTEVIVNNMVAEAIKTSEIEGEYISRQDVLSSIRNKLGLSKVREPVKDRKALGAGELMVAVRNSFALPLTKTILFSWHEILMQHNTKIKVGAWRTHTQPMQVISGAIGKEKIHFEAPPSKQVPAEMKKYIQWFNDTAPGGLKEIKKAPVRAAIAHLYFETIHPFEDGNGRIGRAISEKALFQTMGRPLLLRISQAIEKDKKSYYRCLEKAQKNIEITDWIRYFVTTIFEAQQEASKHIDFTLKKTKFFDHFKDRINERQLKVITKMMEKGPQGFVGGMTANKYISITKTSKATATRDLQMGVEVGVFRSRGGGRSTNYSLNMEK